MWNTILPHFSDTYQCITIDLLGHGKTACLGYIHTMEDMAEMVNAVLKKTKTKNHVLIGHSMGGYVSLAYTDLFPEMTSGLVLLNATSLPDNPERQLNRSRAIAIVKKNPDAYTSMAIANLFAQENRLHYKTQIEEIKDEASKTPLQGIISALEGMKIRKDRTAVLSKFAKPKIIFAGKKDPVLSYAQTLEESKQYKTTLISFDGGHMSYLENKDEVVKSLHKFLKNI